MAHRTGSKPSRKQITSPRSLKQSRTRSLNRERGKAFTPAIHVDDRTTTCWDLLAYSIIVDDIVRHDGTTFMERLGGGGPQTIFGARVFAHAADKQTNVALCARVGNDLPDACLSWLREMGVDLAAIAYDEHLPTPRAWQVCERDGKRTQVWRTQHGDGQIAMLRPAWCAETMAAHVVHLGIDVEHPPWDVLAGAREAGALVSVETFKPTSAPLTSQALAKLSSAVDVLSPNLVEARAMMGDDETVDAKSAAVRLRDEHGFENALVRAGELGAVYAHRGGVCVAPAVGNVDVVDETGCGNACCGAFVSAMHDRQSPADCLAWGMTAASFMLEHVGVPEATLPKTVELEARARYHVVRERTLDKVM